MQRTTAFLIVIVSLLSVACGENYSSGTRVGVVTKLSEKGIVWKSWEGELLMALPSTVGSATQPEKFEFNVAPSAVEKVTAAMQSGHRVELVYRQWWMAPVSIDNDHVVVDVKDAAATSSSAQR